MDINNLKTRKNKKPPYDIEFGICVILIYAHIHICKYNLHKYYIMYINIDTDIQTFIYGHIYGHIFMYT